MDSPEKSKGSPTKRKGATEDSETEFRKKQKMDVEAVQGVEAEEEVEGGEEENAKMKDDDSEEGQDETEESSESSDSSSDEEDCDEDQDSSKQKKSSKSDLMSYESKTEEEKAEEHKVFLAERAKKRLFSANGGVATKEMGLKISGNAKAAALACKLVESLRKTDAKMSEADLRGQWRSEFNRQCKGQEAKQCGLSVEELNLEKLGKKQLIEILLRPVDESFNKKSLCMRLKLWLQVISVSAKMKHAAKQVTRLYGNMSSMSDLQERHVGFRTALESLKMAFMKYKMISIHNDEGIKRAQQVECVQKNLDSFYTAKLNHLDMRQGTKTHLVSKIAQLCTLSPSAEVELQQLTEAKGEYGQFANLFDMILDKAKSMEVVRNEGQVWQAIRTKNGDRTLAYEPWKGEGDIVEFVMNCAYPQKENAALFGALFASGSYWKQIAEMLKVCKDDRFPLIVPSRYWFAWENGVYCTDEDKFYPYDSLAFRHLPKDIVCCMYTDQPFNNDEYEWYVHNSPNGWYDIPEPAMAKVCKTQKWEKDECEWWYAGGGRMLYPACVKENWARMWFHMGRAGCGKTTSLKFWIAFIPSYKVGLLNNNCEKVFTLQSLEKTWAWFGLDIKEDWNLDQTLWNTMVDGGFLSIARKFLATKLTEFNQHGAVASNRLMQWHDINGNLIRRLFPHIYKYAPKTEGVPDLVKEMCKNKGAALKKINLAYRAKVHTHGGETLREDNLPKNVAMNLREIQSEANPLMAFLQSENITCSPNYFMERNEFKKLYDDFLRKKGTRKLPPLNESFFADVLEMKSCYFETDASKLPCTPETKHLLPPPQKNKMWIVGCSSQEKESEQINFVNQPIVNPLLLKPSEAFPEGFKERMKDSLVAKEKNQGVLQIGEIAGPDGKGSLPMPMTLI